jgi:hypothetical protein
LSYLPVKCFKRYILHCSSISLRFTALL